MNKAEKNKKLAEVRRFCLLMKGSAPTAMNHIFSDGGCYRFYLILRAVYPQATAYWNGKECHVITKIFGEYWDICGRVRDPDARPLSIDDHKTAALFHFDEMYFCIRHVRQYIDGDLK